MAPKLKIEKSCQAFTGQTTGVISTKLYRSDQWSIPSITDRFRFAAQNGHQSLKYKNIVWPSQGKLLVGFELNFTGVISTIPSCAHRRHVPLRCTKRPTELKKILSGFHRSNYWWDFN
jgi:hypothetical protein